MMNKNTLMILLPLLIQTPVMAQEANYDETKVPAYTLPDPFLYQDGRHVSSVREWERPRRPESLRRFADRNTAAYLKAR